MKTSTKLLYWIPRILVILAILFVSMFALDSFSSERTFWQNAAAFLMHLIPSFVLAGILIIAWKWEKAGGIILTIVGLVFSVLIFIMNFNRNHSIWMSLWIVLLICIPFVLAGILFIMSYYQKKKELSGV
jgi:Tfp pilus assembly protein PilN